MKAEENLWAGVVGGFHAKCTGLGKFVFKCRVISHINTDFFKHILCTFYWLQLWLSQVNIVHCMGGRGWFVGGGRKFLVAEIQIKQRWDFFWFLGHFWEKIKGGVGGLNWV